MPQLINVASCLNCAPSREPVYVMGSMEPAAFVDKGDKTYSASFYTNEAVDLGALDAFQAQCTICGAQHDISAIASVEYKSGFDLTDLPTDIAPIFWVDMEVYLMRPKALLVKESELYSDELEEAVI